MKKSGVCGFCELPVRPCSCDTPRKCRWQLRCHTCCGFNPLKRFKALRFAVFHEELMAKAWHPRRVESWLAQGEHVLDMMMGVD